MKKMLHIIAALVMALALMLACTVPAMAEATETLELVLMTKDSTTAGFDEWLKKAEETCNLKITVIPTSTNNNDRQAEITTVLSTADTSVDIITVNDEMYTAFKNTGWLEKLNNVMTPEVVAEYPTAYLNDMVITEDGSIFSVPMYFNALGWFVNTDIMKEVGIESVETYEDFLALCKAATNDKRFGYGDAWDPTHLFNSLGSFVNLHGGDYFDWTNEKTQAGLHALYSLLTEGYTTAAQIADVYDQLYQNLVDGNCACGLLYTGNIAKFQKAGLYGDEGSIIMIVPPVVDEEVGATAYCSSWHYVLNSASPNKEAAMRFLNYAASEQGQMDYVLTFGSYPSYLKLLEKPELDSLPGIEQMREYISKVTLRGRPIVPEAMEYITEMGNLFHRLVMGEIDEATFCVEAQSATEYYTE